MPKVATGRKFRKSSTVGAKKALSTPLQTGTSEVDKNEAPVTGSAKLLQREASDTSPQSSSAMLSRGQKKRQMKREQYLRKEHMVLSSLRLKRQEEQIHRIDGLDALKDALMNIESTATPTIPEDTPAPVPSQTKINTNHSRQVLLQKEVAHMNLVLQHPRFVEDPFSTIYEHLQNTFPATIATAPTPKPVTQKRHRHKRHYRATRSKR
jgi:Ribosome biogenesis protein SLX9